MNKKFFLLKLVEQLEEDKVDSLIDVVKSMVYTDNTVPSPANDNSYMNDSMSIYQNSEKIITNNINDVFR